MSFAARSIKIPACERCRKSKTRCDLSVPKCSSCTKSGSACIIVDSATGDRYGREHIHELQQKLASLEAADKEGILIDAMPSQTSATSPAQQRAHYVGNGSGTEMFHRVSTSASTAHARARVMEQLNQRAMRTEPAIACHDLPAPELASILIDRFCSHAHLLHPLASKQSLRATFHRVYNGQRQSTSEQDYYTIFMICAISSITLYRKGEIALHPFGFYRSASKLMAKIAVVGNIQAIQNLLLIARFAMYYHIECSIWDITRLCMRQCIELGLHMPPPSPLPPAEEQLRRNVFWDCYVHDRYSSGILGRPFAIADHDIQVALPVEAGEDQILLTTCRHLDEIDTTQLQMPNEASIFRFVIRLRRVTARSQTRFFSPNTNTATKTRRAIFTRAGQILRDLDAFMTEMDNCRQSAPVFHQPQSLYERAEWHQFMVEKDRLIVIRGAFSNLALCGSHLPSRLLAMCLDTATRVIKLYLHLFSEGAITWTRSYFQILFTSGMSTIYAMSQLKSDDSIAQEVLHDASATLRTCSELLSRFVSEMPDAGRFAEIFEALSRPYTMKNSSAASQVASDVLSRADSIPHHSTDGNMMTELDNDFHGLRPSETIRNDLWQGDFLSFDFDMQDGWPLISGTSANPFGQMEAGLGQYAWGTQHDANDWQQYFLR